MLAVDAVTFAYEGQTEPYHFDLTVAPGEIVAVTGKSGSGKSTLLDLIAGFLAPHAGTISVDEDDITTHAPEDRPVSILFQDDNLFEHLSAAANLELGLPRAERKTGQEAVEAALREVGLEGYGQRRVARLSGGQKQRVALARTLLRNRPVVLLDEPFTALDPETAEAMRRLVARLTRAHDWHVLLVSHIEQDATRLATRRLHLEDGRLHPVG